MSRTISFLIYASNGEILRYGKCPLHWLDLQVGEDEAVLAGYHGEPETSYVVDGKLVPRPTINVGAAKTAFTMGEDAVVLSAIPDDTKVYLNNKLVGEITDGSLEFEATEPGRVTVRLEPPFPYLAATLEIIVS